MKENTNGLLNNLLSGFDKNGWRASIVGVERLDDLRNGIETLHSNGTLDGVIYKYLSGLNYDIPKDMPGAKSLITIAISDPHVRFTFNYGGKETSYIVPPTYLHFQRVVRKINNIAEGVLSAAGLRIILSRVPYKALAVRSGLAEYGKNNIAYVAGMGSYHRLITFFTELPTERDVWGEPVMMESCSNCSACIAACPADVITPDRSVIFAERCITYHNEEPVDVPFPEWMEPSWHECIVGCLYCQRVCPVNREIGGQFIDGGEFTEEETSSFLKATSLDNLPATTLKKLEDSGLIVFNEILPRNLKVLLGQVDSK